MNFNSIINSLVEHLIKSVYFHIWKKYVHELWLLYYYILVQHARAPKWLCIVQANHLYT